MAEIRAGSPLEELAELLGELFGLIDAHTVMLRLICRHVGVTGDELKAEAERIKARG